MKTKNLRIAIPIAILVIAGVGYAVGGGVGTLSSFGWQDISLLCPLGSLSTMLAAKLVVPRALVSLAIAVVLILLVGRAFCAWVCPVPVVQKLRDIFGNKPAEQGLQEGCVDEASESCSSKHGCSSCAKTRAALDSRHFVLGGALASAAIFGFPVFCLICPIGLTFATVFLLISLFSGGDTTWAVLIVPLVLLAEVVFFRKWCSHFCPLAALMSLVGKFNKTFKPQIDESVCLESSKGAGCSRCTQACPEGIDVRHPEQGASWSECTRCSECVEACPTQAITLPLLPKKNGPKAEELDMKQEDKASA